MPDPAPESEFLAAEGEATMACCGTRSRVDGPDMCTLCLEPLPLPGPGADVVLKLHACGHCFHRDCAQEMLLNSLRKYEKPRCPNCRATLFTAPFGKLLGQRRQPRAKRMRNMRELISVSEVRLTPASAPAPPAPSPSINDTPISTTPDVAHHESFHGSTFLQLNPPLCPPLDSQEYMKSKNWRVPKRNAVGSTEAQRALAGLIIQSRKDFAEEFGEDP